MHLFGLTLTPISSAAGNARSLAAGHPAPHISGMKALTMTAVATAMQAAQAGALVGREVCERDSVLRELHRLLRMPDVRLRQFSAARSPGPARTTSPPFAPIAQVGFTAPTARRRRTPAATRRNGAGRGTGCRQSSAGQQNPTAPDQTDRGRAPHLGSHRLHARFPSDRRY
jgi:hypothetical protein